MSNYRYHFQLVDAPNGHFAGPAIMTSGGKAIVTVAGSPTRATLTDSTGAALANPISLTRGAGEFYTTETSVDLFIQCPDGQSKQLYGATPDGVADICVDRSRPTQLMVIPITFADDSADNTESTTGFTEPTGAVFTPDGSAVKVHTLDATETIDVGTAEGILGGGGDSDGFCSAVALDTAVIVQDAGALLGAGASNHLSAGLTITFKFSAGVDTAKVYAMLPYVLLQTSVPTP